MNTRTNAPSVGTPQTEAEILARTEALLVAGKDPFGDDGEDDAIEAEADGDDADESPGTTKPVDIDSDDDDEPVEAKVDDDLSPEALAKIAEEPTEAPAQRTQRYKAADPAEFTAQRIELNTLKAKGLRDLMDGVIEPEAYSAIEADVADKLDALTVQRTLHEANTQSEQQLQGGVLDAILTAAKKAGEVDYTDPKAARQFDQAMKMLGEDGETRTFEQLAGATHKMVMALRGVTAKAPAAEPSTKPRENGRGPVTLRNIPTAAVANTGGGWQEQIGALSGQAYEAAYAKLTPSQREQLLND
jgi:hypothetical protein